jgi:Domain of unknown function (DUF4386)/Histidine kinase
MRQAVGAPIIVDGRLWGAMNAGSVGERPLPADTETRLVSFTELVATAVANAESRAALAASRARIVAAADESRRQIRRDLHDGAQQRLVSAVVGLKLASRALDNGGANATELVAEALRDAEEANAELRELAHGILPVTNTGLRGGLDALVSRIPLRVAHADQATVTVHAEGRQLRVEIRDAGSEAPTPSRGPDSSGSATESRHSAGRSSSPARPAAPPRCSSTSRSRSQRALGPRSVEESIPLTTEVAHDCVSLDSHACRDVRSGPRRTARDRRFKMSLDQKRARAFGVLYLITFVTSIPALALYQPVLDDPVGYIAGAGHDTQILFAALLELLLIIANIGTAVVIFPIVRRQNEELALGYVTARVIECTFILVGILSVLGIITLRNQVAGASEGTVAYTLAGIKDWTFLLGPGWVVGWGNGLILGYLMYRSELVPRRAAWLGLIGGPLIIVSGTAVMLSGDHPSDTLRSLQGFATIPEFLWELFLGVYCSFKGFRPSSRILQAEASRDRTPAVTAVAPA